MPRSRRSTKTGSTGTIGVSRSCFRWGDTRRWSRARIPTAPRAATASASSGWRRDRDRGAADRRGQLSPGDLPADLAPLAARPRAPGRLVPPGPPAGAPFELWARAAGLRPRRPREVAHAVLRRAAARLRGAGVGRPAWTALLDPRGDPGDGLRTAGLRSRPLPPAPLLARPLRSF